jgi:hypothetical protein
MSKKIIENVAFTPHERPRGAHHYVAMCKVLKNIFGWPIPLFVTLTVHFESIYTTALLCSP